MPCAPCRQTTWLPSRHTSPRVRIAGASSRLVAGRRIKVPGESLAGLSRREINSVTPKPDTGKANKASRVAVNTASRVAGSNAVKANRRVHIVRRGDTLIEIARRYDLTLTELASHNSLSRRSKINIGTRLEIPAK